MTLDDKVATVKGIDHLILKIASTEGADFAQALAQAVVCLLNLERERLDDEIRRERALAIVRPA